MSQYENCKSRNLYQEKYKLFSNKFWLGMIRVRLWLWLLLNQASFCLEANYSATDNSCIMNNFQNKNSIFIYNTPKMPLFFNFEKLTKLDFSVCQNKVKKFIHSAIVIVSRICFELFPATISPYELDLNSMKSIFSSQVGTHSSKILSGSYRNGIELKNVTHLSH